MNGGGRIVTRNLIDIVAENPKQDFGAIAPMPTSVALEGYGLCADAASASFNSGQTAHGLDDNGPHGLLQTGSTDAGWEYWSTGGDATRDHLRFGNRFRAFVRFQVLHITNYRLFIGFAGTHLLSTLMDQHWHVHPVIGLEADTSRPITDWVWEENLEVTDGGTRSAADVASTAMRVLEFLGESGSLTCRLYDDSKTLLSEKVYTGSDVFADGDALKFMAGIRTYAAEDKHMKLYGYKVQTHRS